MEVATAQQLLEKAVAALTADLPRLLDEIDELLPRYRGVPTRLSVFEVLGIQRDEDLHTEFLGWVLDPAREHGLSDAVLRRVLLFSRNRWAVLAALQPAALQASVHTQFNVPRFGTPDIVVVVGGDPIVVLIIEAKIDAGLTRDAASVPQTVRYRRAVASGALQKALRIDDSRRVEVAFLFLHAESGVEAEDDEEIDASLASVGRFVPMLYREMEGVLADVASHGDAEPQAAMLLAQFRTSMLALSDGGSLLGVLQQLRLARYTANVRGRSHDLTADLRRGLSKLRGDDGQMEDIDPELVRLVLAEQSAIAELARILERTRDEALRGLIVAVEASDAYKEVDALLAANDSVWTKNALRDPPGQHFGLTKKGAKTAAVVLQARLLEPKDGQVGFEIRLAVYAQAVGGVGKRRELTEQVTPPAGVDKSEAWDQEGLSVTRISAGSPEEAVRLGAARAAETLKVAGEIFRRFVTPALPMQGDEPPAVE